MTVTVAATAALTSIPRATESTMSSDPHKAAMRTYELRR